MKKFLLIFLLISILNLHSITLEQAALNLSADLNISSKEILNCFQNVKIYFKANNILESIKKDNFNSVKFNETKLIESQIVELIKKHHNDFNEINLNVNDLKDHAKFRIIYNKYLKNSKNAFFYYNFLLNETLLLSVSQKFVILSFLRFNSYYEDTDRSGLIKKLYLKFFIIERASGKITVY